MIILFDEKEQSFDTIGIGVLKDASLCVVTEELNGSYELEMEYPVTGSHYSDIKQKRIIYAKPNDISDPQPFRIYKITKPIDGVVSIYAEHISYDASKVPIKAFKAENLNDLCQQVKQKEIINSNFNIINNLGEGASNIMYQTKIPHSLRSLLAGEDETILNTYGGEFEFDKYNIIIHERRGSDKDFTIRYSKNMLDLEQEESSELMFDGVCPYYSSTTSSTTTAMTKKYKEAYISKDAAEIKDEYYADEEGTIRIYPPKWITYTDGQVGISSVVSGVVSYIVTNIIATEGEFYNHIIRAKSIKAWVKREGSTIIEQTDSESGYIFDVTYNMAWIDPQIDKLNKYSKEWLLKDDSAEIHTWNPTDGQLFRIYTEGEDLYNVYIYDASEQKYKLVTKEAYPDIEVYGPTMPSVSSNTTEKDNIFTYEGDIIYINEVRALPKEGTEMYSENWLQEITELLQSYESDPRWEVKEDIIPEKGIIYKVPAIETLIEAETNLNVDLYSKDSLYYRGTTDIIEPINGQGYNILSTVKETEGQYFHYRWNEDNQKYEPMSDTRYTYTNYIWDGTSYIVHSDTSNDKIVTLDLTDKFDETPTNNTRFQKKLYEEAINYISTNKLGEVKDSIKVSFTKLSASKEYSKWKELEKVELGDTVHVIYEDLGIDEQKKVSKTEYNVLTESYESIELGESSNKFTNDAITAGDKVSALTNDRRYADLTTVSKLVAKELEADYLKAKKADITEAEINVLTSEELNVTLINAQRFAIDELVAGLLVSDNAAIRKQLTVGENLIVNGKVNINNGTIAITNDYIIIDGNRIYPTKAFINDNATSEYDIDWLKSSINSTESFTPDPTKIYKVFDHNNIWIQDYYKWNINTAKYEIFNSTTGTVFKVDQNGNLYANSATIKGHITADSLTISQNATISGTLSADNIKGGTITSSAINVNNGTFVVTNNGSVTIKEGSLSISSDAGMFNVSNNGVLTAKYADISGAIVATSGKIGDFNIVTNYLSTNSLRINHYDSTNVGLLLNNDGISFYNNVTSFSLTKDGIRSKDITIYYRDNSDIGYVESGTKPFLYLPLMDASISVDFDYRFIVNEYADRNKYIFISVVKNITIPKNKSSTVTITYPGKQYEMETVFAQQLLDSHNTYENIQISIEKQDVDPDFPSEVYKCTIYNKSNNDLTVDLIIISLKK